MGVTIDKISGNPMLHKHTVGDIKTSNSPDASKALFGDGQWKVPGDVGSSSGANVGTGVGIYKQLNGSVLEFKSLLGDGVSFTGGTDEVTATNTDKGSTAVSAHESAYNHSNLHTHTNKALLDTLTNSGSGNQFLADDGSYKSVSTADEKVKASATDTTAGYLSDKVDNSTIEVSSQKLKVKDNVFADKTHSHQSIDVTDFQTAVSSNSDVSANTSARHTHSNKALLDTYTQTETDLADAVSKKHARAHDLTSSADHNPATGTNKGKYLKTNATTGNPELVSLSTVAESGSYDDLSDKPDLSVYFHKTNDTLDNINEGTTNKHLTSTLKSNYDTAYTHSQSSHPFGLIGTKDVDETGIGDGKILKYDATSGKYKLYDLPASSGDVTGPSSSTDSNIVSFNGTTGKVIKDSGISSSSVSSAISNSHSRQHSITSTADHTSTATPGKILKADANGLPIDATNTDTEVANAVSKSHDAVTVTDGATIDFTLTGQDITAEVKDGTITETKLSLSDVTTLNVSTTKHGFVPKAPNNTSQFLRGDGTWATPTASVDQFQTARLNPFYYTDFLGAASATSVEAAYPFDLALISSGTQAKIAGEANHPGILRISSSTTANSGGYILTDTSAFLIGGGEVFEVIFQPSVASNTNTTIRMGFLDATTYADAVDGAYFELPAGSLAIVGKTASNSTRSTTGTSYTLTVSTWYRARLEVNSSATQVNFYVYDSNGTQLWTNNLTTNIPTGSGRNTGAGVIATNSGTTATLLAYFDYMAVGVINRNLTR